MRCQASLAAASRGRPAEKLGAEVHETDPACGGDLPRHPWGWSRAGSERCLWCNGYPDQTTIGRRNTRVGGGCLWRSRDLNRVTDDDLVSSFRLGPIQGIIGSVQQGIGTVPVIGVHGNTEGKRHRSQQ